MLDKTLLIVVIALLVIIVLLGVTLWKSRHKDAKVLRPSFSIIPSDALPHATPYYLFLDVQTTGLDADVDRLLEVGYLVTDRHGARCAGAVLHIRQDDLGSLDARRVHQITEDENLKHGVPERDALVSIVSLLSLYDDVYVVSHNVAFDVHMIASALARHGMSADDLLERLQYFCTMTLDVTLSKKIGRYRKLEVLSHVMGGSDADRLLEVMPISYRHVLQTRLCFFQMQRVYEEFENCQPTAFYDLEEINIDS